MTDDVDKILLLKIKQGDKQAFNLLIQKYQNKISAIIAKYLYNSSDILDITQETFIKAYKAIDNFRGDSSFYTWIYRIAINCSKNFLISQGRKPPSRDLDIDNVEYMDKLVFLEDKKNPESLMLSDELRNTIFSSIENLSPELKKTITLRELEGMTYEEIAKKMDCPVGTVRSRIFRARETIDEKILPLLKN